jgi:hypothetical protein
MGSTSSLSTIAPHQYRYRVPTSVSGSEFNQVSGYVYGSGSRMAKMTRKNRKNFEISYFEVLDVLF